MMASIPRPANIPEGKAACWRCGLEYTAGGGWLPTAPCSACRYQLEQDDVDLDQWRTEAALAARNGTPKPKRQASAGTASARRWARMTPDQRKALAARRRERARARREA